ncbi:RimK/LysX family protein [Vibrio lamellibrachiae]|uniref:putative ATP-dependent zinc protease n=1 Tax=Vibrio lamellibrachiae TaxID=2910253 RepID=UPI003D13D704
MKKTGLIAVSLLVSTVSFVTQAEQCSVDNMEVIGQKAFIDIEGFDSAYRARIDTGATRTSLHAMNIEVIDGVDELDANIGKEVRFVTGNELGDYNQHQAEIVAVRRIRNSFGADIRYSVNFTLAHEGYEKTVEVNLRDRSKMTDKLLIGRDWLSCQYLVDVSQNPTTSS